MPLIVICGRPCVGKTTFANELRKYLLKETMGSSSSSSSSLETESTTSTGGGSRVILLNDESLGIKKSSGYATATSEKSSRGLHKSSIDRALSGTSTIVIMDGLNYIKGYRYELYCLARGANTPMVVIWVGPDAKIEDARYRNRVRRGNKVNPSSSSSSSSSDSSSSSSSVSSYVTGDGYDDESFLDLWLRFEAPDERNRWDSPLFRVTGLASPDYTTLPLLHDISSSSSSLTPNNTLTNPSGPYFTSKFELNKIYTANDLFEASAGGNLVGNASNTTIINSSNKLNKFRRYGKDKEEDYYAEDIDVANLADFDNIDLDDFNDNLDDPDSNGDRGKDNSVGNNGVNVTNNQNTGLASNGASVPTNTSIPNTTVTPVSSVASTAPKKSAFRKGVAVGTTVTTPLSSSSSSSTTLIHPSSSSSTTTTVPSVSFTTTTVNPTPLPSTTAPSTSAPSLPGKHLLSWDDACNQVHHQVLSGKVLRPPTAVKSIPSFSVDFLFELETRTSEVIAYIAKEVLGSTTGANLIGGGNTGGLGYSLTVPGSTSVVYLSKKPTLLQLKRIQRTFIKITTDSSLALINSGDGETASGKITNALFSANGAVNNQVGGTSGDGTPSTDATTTTTMTTNNTTSNGSSTNPTPAVPTAAVNKESWGKILGDVDSIKRRFIDYLNVTLRET